MFVTNLHQIITVIRTVYWQLKSVAVYGSGQVTEISIVDSILLSYKLKF